MSKKISSGYLVWSNIPQGKIGPIEFRGSERPFDRKNVGNIVPVVGCGVIGEGVEADVNVLFRASDLKVTEALQNPTEKRNEQTDHPKRRQLSC